jgi:hypothetical protein
MGTRSLTFTYDNQGTKILCLYRQFDGYPEGHGKDLAEILNITDNNGMECLSASIVAKLKTGSYNVYIYPSDTKNAWQDYEYHVYEDRVEIHKHFSDTNEPMFKGTYQEFLEFCVNQDRKVA